MSGGFPTLLVLVAGLGLIAALGTAAAAVHVSSWRLRVPLGLLALVCLAPGALLLLMRYPELVDARFGTYKALYADIEPGMTREDVLRLVEVHYPPGGPRLSPRAFKDEADALGFYMNPEGKTEPNCEGILLDLEDGRVTSKQYSAD